MPRSPIKIIFVGGGTMGPVSPLLAIAERIKREHSDAKFLFVGTSYGPERKAVETFGAPFKSIMAGRLRRYLSFKNALTPIASFFGFVQSLILLSSFKPDIVVGAGGFTQVPLMYAAWLLRIPRVIHQQDVDVTLSNAVCAMIANKITVTFQHSTREFNQGVGLFSHTNNKVVWTGNPVRYEEQQLPSQQEALKFFGLREGLPVVLVTGGSSGAAALNELVREAVPQLTNFSQVLHTAGARGEAVSSNEQYHPYQFIDRMDMAFAAADIVVSRAGLSAISELSALGKPSIIIPMPKTHQESNAALLYSAQAAVVIDQNTTDAEEFVATIRNLLLNGEQQKQLVMNMREIMPTGAAEQIAKIIIELAQ